MSFFLLLLVPFWVGAQINNLEKELLLGEQPKVSEHLQYGEIPEPDPYAEVLPQASQLSWLEQATQNQSCSSQTLNQHLDDFRSLYRFLSLSYLYESLEYYQLTKLRLQQKPIIKLETLLQNCQPQSSTMQGFLERLNYAFMNDYLPANQLLAGFFSTSEKSTWFLQWNSIKTKKSSDLALQQLAVLCEYQKCPQGASEALDLLATELKERFLFLCSEKDFYYGYAENSFLQEVLHEFQVKSLAPACYQVYAQNFQSRERSDVFLGKVLKTVYQDLQAQKKWEQESTINLSQRVSLYGKPFLLGALSLFGQKIEGLFSRKNFIATNSAQASLKKTPATSVEKPQAKLVIEKPQKVVTKLSAFETAYQQLASQPLVNLNMQQFRQDFRLSPRMVQAIQKPLEKYQTRKALKQMKEFDKLGKESEPIRLLFLKFLIETGQHQGLYNLKAVLGDSFYVVNDLEQKTLPIPMSLINEKGIWKISLLQELPGS